MYDFLFLGLSSEVLNNLELDNDFARTERSTEPTAGDSA